MNIGVQYLIELHHQQKRGEDHGQSLRMALILLTEAAIVLGDAALFRKVGTLWLSLAAILFGIGSVMLFGQRKSGRLVDFPHLSERAMLYVVFTFGEMIIGISTYFEGDFSIRSTYFALMAFLIVVGLFLSYGFFYDHIIDREKQTNGLRYMLWHIFIIFAMNNITNGLEFMREEEIRILPKLLLLIGSFVLFFGALFVLGNSHAKARCGKYPQLCGRAALIGTVFLVLMILLRAQMLWNIALSAVFVFVLFGMIYQYGKTMDL